MIDVNIPAEWIDKCEQFSLECAQTNLSRYKSRGQSVINKIVSDIFVGKMGECAVYLNKVSLGLECSEPDFNIYRGRQKSYDADLRSENRKLHVKTQSLNSATKYGTSWILQAKEGDADKLFKHRDDNDFAVLCVMKSDTLVTILAEVSIIWLFVNHLIEEPKIKFFIGTKKALYWSNIQARLEGSRECSKCNKLQGKEAFYRGKTCKTCCIKRKKDSTAKNPNMRKNSELLRTYGITVEVYLKMLESQRHTCGICEQVEKAISARSLKRKDLAVDRCSKTGRIRGLLCMNCKTSLSKYEKLRDSIDKYLTANPSDDTSEAA
jgi:hypothetical protein